MRVSNQASTNTCWRFQRGPDRTSNTSRAWSPGSPEHSAAISTFHRRRHGGTRRRRPQSWSVVALGLDLQPAGSDSGGTLVQGCPASLAPSWSAGRGHVERSFPACKGSVTPCLDFGLEEAQADMRHCNKTTTATGMTAVTPFGSPLCLRLPPSKECPSARSYLIVAH